MAIFFNESQINDWYFADDNIVKVYRNGAVCYYKVVVGETAQTPCYAVVDDITQYQDREFENVFNKADDKWYKLNNLNEYEEYGVYASGRTITYYEGKLTIDEETSSRLPQGYTEVEYVQNTGTSTINTNFYPNTNTRVLCEMEMITTQTYPKLFGAGTWNVNNSLYIEFATSLSVHWIGSSAVNYSNYPKSFAFAKHEYDLNKGNLYIDDTLVGTKSYSSVVSVSSPFGIFSYINGSTAGNADEHFLGKLYTFKIYDDGTLVREFIPAKRDSDNVAGLYDIVNDVFYTTMESNAPLVAGEPIAPTKTYEYIYSGGSWVNVGEVSGSTYPIYYDEIQDPPTQVSFSSMTEAEQYECPYVGLMATINGDLYFFNDNYQWELIPVFEGKWKATYSGGTITTAACDSSSAITSSAITNGEITKEGLVNVVIGDCVTNIGKQAFYGCSGLTSCTIGSGVTSIGASAFFSCNSLTSVTIPNTVISISRDAFNHCSGLTGITIPSGVIIINNGAFDGCSGLTSITVLATKPPTLGSSVFDNTNNCPIYVPSGSVEAYKTAWSAYASRIQAKL